MDELTDRDVRDYVTASLDASGTEYDVDAIVEHLVREHGIAAEYDPEALWAIVAEHEAAERPDPFEQFVADLGDAMAAAPIGESATWTDGTVTLAVRGMSRVSRTWPQILATLTLTAPDGGVEELRGEDVASWDELWARVQAAATRWESTADLLLMHVAGAHAGLERAERAAEAARTRRDALVRQTQAAGVSPYRIAKRLGVAESTVGRILARG